MTSDLRGVLELRPDPSLLAIDRAEVRRLARCGPASRWEDWVARAEKEARSLLAPAVRAVPVEAASAGSLFSGTTPVEEIARRGECWAFVATIGPRLEREVERRFAADDAVEGLFLDAAGSSGVEALCDMAERLCGDGGATARFSPGYCGWGVADQGLLLGLLEPGDLGVELLPSMMMRPVKSVAGLVVRGAPGELTVPPEACSECDAAGCTRRPAGGGRS